MGMQSVPEAKGFEDMVILTPLGGAPRVKNGEVVRRSLLIYVLALALISTC